MENTIVEDKIMLNSLRELVYECMKNGSTDCVRRKKMYVTEGPHENSNGKNVITVQEAFGDRFEIPYVPSLYNAAAGDSVWVEWVYGFGNACAVNSGAWQASDLPTCVVPTEDGLIMQVNYVPVLVISESGVSINADTLEVSGHIQGDVVNVQGSKEVTVNGKIQDVIDSLGKYLSGDVTINIPAATYVEDIDISGFHGPGTLTMTFDAGAIINGDLKIKQSKRVLLTGTDDGTNVTQIIGQMEDGVIDVSATDYLKISTVEIHGVERGSGDSGQSYGVYVRDGSYVYMADDVIDRVQTGVYVEHAHLDIRDCTGGYNSTDETTVANLTNGIIISEDGGYVNAKGTIPAGPDVEGTGYEQNGYPFTCSGTVSPVVSGGEAPPQVTEVTTTWTASAGYYCESYKTGEESYQSRGTGWKGDGTYNPRMGYNSSTKKYMAGLWIFDDADTIQETLADATITKATITMTRSGGSGASSGDVVKPYYHGITANTLQNFSAQCDPWGISSSSDDWYINCGCAEQYIDFGEKGTFELPSTMYELLQNGTVKGFAIGMDASREFFQFLPKGCVLTVTYEI